MEYIISVYIDDSLTDGDFIHIWNDKITIEEHFGKDKIERFELNGENYSYQQIEKILLIDNPNNEII